MKQFLFLLLLAAPVYVLAQHSPEPHTPEVHEEHTPEPPSHEINSAPINIEVHVPERQRGEPGNAGGSGNNKGGSTPDVPGKTSVSPGAKAAVAQAKQTTQAANGVRTITQQRELIRQLGDMKANAAAKNDRADAKYYEQEEKGARDELTKLGG